MQDQFFRSNRMDFFGLRLEYVLEGILNFVSWKDDMEVVLEENGLKEFFKIHIPKSGSSNVKDLVEWRKFVAKVRRNILEGVKDHIVSNLHVK